MCAIVVTCSVHYINCTRNVRRVLNFTHCTYHTMLFSSKPCVIWQVGAAISMTYTTGQPIVFVGTGQTYTDLKNLNAKAVVHALLKA